MKNKHIALIIIVVLAALIAAYFFWYRTEGDVYKVDAGDFYKVENTDTADINTAPLSEQEKTWLLQMREEEKVARDVYTTLGEKWNKQVFFNIAASEQTHTDAIKALLEKYGLEDPVKDNSVGAFSSPVMQGLYTTLVEQGNISLLNALIVGATVEDLDIKDLSDAMSVTTHEDINVVYRNLQKGSRNHLRAFVKNIDKNGGTYSPSYISVDEYQSIIGSSQEKGTVN